MATGAVKVSTVQCSSREGAPTHRYRKPRRKIPPWVPERGNEHPKLTDLLVPDICDRLSTMTATCFCGKVCKNLRGLRIHQTRMGCIRRKQAEQRTEPVPSTDPGKTEEEQEPESPHSVQNLQAQHAAPSKPSEQRRVLWPAANKVSEWHQFDEDVDATLDAACRGDSDCN